MGLPFVIEGQTNNKQTKKEIFNLMSGSDELRRETKELQVIGILQIGSKQTLYGGDI